MFRFLSGLKSLTNGPVFSNCVDFIKKAPIINLSLIVLGIQRALRAFIFSKMSEC